MDNVISIIKKYNFDVYMAMLVIITLFSYVFHLQLFLAIVVCIALPILIFKKSSIVYLIPLLFILKMSISSYSEYSGYRMYYSLIVATFLIFDFFKNRKLHKFGRLAIPFILLIVASILSAFFGPSLMSGAMSVYMMGLFFAAYLYFVNTLKKDDMINVIKVLLYFSILITSEHIYLIFIDGTFPESFISRANLRIGWANINFAVFVNLIALPLVAYLIIITKKNYYYMYGFLFVVFGILLTRSRSANITLLVILILLIPIVLYYADSKRRLIRNAAIVLFTVAIGIAPFIYNGMIEEFFKVIISREFVLDDARIEIFKVGWDQFLKYPVFGSGGIYSSRVYLDEFGPNNYHNILLQTLTLGIAGLAAFIYLWFEKIKLLFRSVNKYKWFVLVMLLTTTFVNGLVQPVYYNMNYSIYMLLVVASFEVAASKEPSNEDIIKKL